VTGNVAGHTRSQERETAIAGRLTRVAPWKWPFLVLAIAVPIALAFYAGGPGIGVAVGALVAVAIVYLAVRAEPRRPLGGAPGSASRRRLLVVVTRPGQGAETTAAIARRASGEDPGGGGPRVLVLAPARIGFLDRWASDLEGARREAQQNLVLTVASLAKAGIAAEARVGDEDIVQAVEDTLSEFAATDVVLITGGEEDPGAAKAAAELRSRLRPRFEHLVLSGQAAR
jgi:hypothetical protein